MDGVVNPIDEFRDLFETFLGLNFVVHDLQVIETCLNPNLPNGDC